MASVPLTSTADSHPRLSAARFLAGAILTTALGAGLLAAILALLNDGACWRGYAAGVVAGVVALVTSAFPLTLLFRRPLAMLMNGVLLAGGVRAATLGAVVVFAIRAGGYPQNPTVACAAFMYVFIVVGEGLLLWSMIADNASTAARHFHALSAPSTAEAP